MRAGVLLVVAAALLFCGTPALAERKQLQAIWSLKGVASPLPDDQVVEFIGQVVNKVTDYPWGSQTQSGGFDYLCTQKLGIDCNAQYPDVSAAATTGKAGSGGSSSKNSAASGASGDKASSSTSGGSSGGNSKASASTGGSSSQNSKSTGGSSAAGGARKLLQGVGGGRIGDTSAPGARRPPSNTTNTGKGSTGTTDSGTPDAGTTNTGTGTTDAGTTNAGTTDAGTTDAGTTDAGTSSGGSSGDKAYLYLDTTEATAGLWSQEQVDSLVNTLRTSMKDGSFQALLDETSIVAEAKLLYLNMAMIPDPSPSPSPEPMPEALASPSPEAFPLGGASPDPWSSPQAAKDPFGGDSSGGSTNSGKPPSSPKPSSSSKNGTSSSSSNSSSSDSDSGGSNSKTIVIVAVIGGVIAAAVLAALVGTCMLRSKRKAQQKVNADLMVHRWKREREQTKAYSAKLAGSSARSPFDRSQSIREAKAMANKDLNHDEFRTYRSSKTFNNQRAELGLSRSNTWADRSTSAPPPARAPESDMVDIDYEKDAVLDASQTRSSAPEYPPAEKKKKFFGLIKK